MQVLLRRTLPQQLQQSPQITPPQPPESDSVSITLATIITTITTLIIIKPPLHPHNPFLVIVYKIRRLQTNKTQLDKMLAAVGLIMLQSI